VRAIGVDWGYHERAELFAAGAHAVAGTVAELAELLHAVG
jgi:phosphoglycolate phosphatase